MDLIMYGMTTTGSLSDAKIVYLLKNMLRVVVRMNTDVYQQNYKAVMLITTETGTVLMGKGEKMMVDREKVIRGLEKCKRHECDDCAEKGASQAPWDCPAYDDFVDSALALLKEQEPVEPEQVDVYGEDEWWGFVCVCPDCKTEWMCDKDATHFCPNCGRPVKWE